MTRNNLILFFIISMFLISCNKTAPNIPLPKLNLPDSSETVAGLDATAFGVYKAALSGNTGHVKLYFRNGDSTMKAYLFVDSLSDTLQCVQSFTVGQPISNAIFSGRIASFIFNADSAGNNATIDDIFIAGHSLIKGAIAHEKTGMPVYCYEAPFTGTQRGNFNFIKFGSAVKAVASFSNNLSIFTGDGLLTGTVFNLSLTMFGSTSTTLNFEGGLDPTTDYFSGSWTSTSGGSGIFSGKRAL